MPNELTAKLDKTPYVFSAIWCLVSLFFVGLVQRVSIHPLIQSLEFLLPLITVCFIAWTTVAIIRLHRETHRFLDTLPLAVVQITLYFVLFIQIAHHFGAHHYRWESIPTWQDWLVFVGVHGIRAGDPVDTLEAYGWNIQRIQHNSSLTTAILLWFHTCVCVFVVTGLARLLSMTVRMIQSVSKTAWIRILIGLIAIGVTSLAVLLVLKKITFFDIFIFAFLGTPVILVGLLIGGLAFGFRGAMKDPENKGCFSSTFGIVIGLISLIGCILTLNVREGALWFFDSLIRVADIPDFIELTRIQIHSVPRTAGWSTLTLLIRIGLSLIIGRMFAVWATSISIRHFDGIFLALPTLEKLSADPDPSISRPATQLVSTIAKNQRSSTMTLSNGVKCFALVILVGAVSYFSFPSIDASHRRAEVLAELAVAENDSSTIGALGRLARMGPSAEAAIPILADSMGRVSNERQLYMIDCLGSLGPQAIDELDKFVLDANEVKSLAAIRALNRIGPAASASLSMSVQSESPRVSKAGQRSLLSFGKDATMPLLMSIRPENAHFVMPQLVQSNRYWHQIECSNIYSEDLQRSRQLLLAVIDGTDDYLLTPPNWVPINHLGVDLNSVSELLCQKIIAEESSFEFASLDLLERLGPTPAGLPFLPRLLADRRSQVGDTGLRLLQFYGDPECDIDLNPLANTLATKIVSQELSLAEISALKILWGKGLVNQQRWPAIVNALNVRCGDNPESSRNRDRMDLILYCGELGNSTIDALAEKSFHLEFDAKRARESMQSSRSSLTLPQIHALLKQMESSDVKVQEQAIIDLGQASNHSSMVIKQLQPLLMNGNGNIRNRAMESLLMLDANGWWWGRWIHYTGDEATNDYLDSLNK